MYLCTIGLGSQKPLPPNPSQTTSGHQLTLAHKPIRTLKAIFPSQGDQFKKGSIAENIRFAGGLEPRGFKRYINGLLESLGLKKNINAKDEDGYTALHRAAMGGQLDDIQTLLNQGAALEENCYWDKYTALHLAAENGHVKAVEALLNKGALIDAKNDAGSTAIHLAIEAGQKEVFEALLSAGASAHEQNKRGLTPLELVIETAKTSKDMNWTSEKLRNADFPGMIRKLVAAGVDLDKENTEGKIPRDSVSYYSDWELVKALTSDQQIRSLKVGITREEKVDHLAQMAANWWTVALNHPSAKSEKPDIGKLDQYEFAPGSAKFKFNQVLKGRIFKALGGDTNDLSKIEITTQPSYKNNILSVKHAMANAGLEYTCNSFGYKAHMKIDPGYGQKITFLLNGHSDRHDLPENPLHNAVAKNDCEYVRHILALNPALVNDVSLLNGGTPLMSAAFLNKENVVEVLLAHGANVNIVDAYGQTAISTAAQKGYTRIIEHLLLHGAKLGPANKHHPSYKYASPLLMAAAHGQLAAVQQLIKAGDDINYKTKVVHGWNDESILHDRYYDGSGQGSIWTGRSTSPLRAAALYNHQEVVQALLDAGVDLTVEGPKAVRFADMKFPKIAELIKKHPNYPKEEKLGRHTAMGL